MENKQAYKIATVTFNALKKANLLATQKGQSDLIKDTIFRAIKSITIEALIAHAQPATKASSKSTADKTVDSKENIEEFELSHRLATDKTYARGYLIKELVRQTSNNNASAAKELRDILQIGSATDDLQIELVDYENAVLECPGCGVSLLAPESVG